MDLTEINTQVAQTLDAHSTDVLEEYDERLLFAVARDAVLELRKKLRKPITEKDITAISGERGINMPSDFIKLSDEPTAIRLGPDGANSEGKTLHLVPESALYA